MDRVVEVRPRRGFGGFCFRKYAIEPRQHLKRLFVVVFPVVERGGVDSAFHSVVGLSG